jgi:hypothetical protein
MFKILCTCIPIYFSKMIIELSKKILQKQLQIKLETWEYDVTILEERLLYEWCWCIYILRSNCQEL